MAKTLLVLIFCAAPALAWSAAPACPHHLATLAPDGSVRAGSKQALRDAFSAGLPLRVGWRLDFDDDGAPEVAHWSAAGFLTEFEGELFAQVHDIQRQQPRRATASVALPPGRLRWSGLIGTTGVLESHFDDGSEPRSLRVESHWCVDAAACAPAWRLVYQNDADGLAVAGSKPALFDAVRRGQPLRLAWGFSAERSGTLLRLEHSAEPVFVTVVGGELFAQLPEHVGQSSYHEADEIGLGEPAVMWRGLLGTSGVFDAVWADRAKGTEVRRLPQRARVAWFAFAAPPLCEAPPVELAVPGGVRRVTPPQP